MRMKQMVYMATVDGLVVFLDTNIIYPLIIRDILFWLAYHDVFVPKWSVHVFDEWRRVMSRKGIGKDIVDKRIDAANLAFPGALVKDYEDLIPMLDLPDVDDRHVLAAAIRSGAKIIVTNNVRDFPADRLKAYNLIAMNTDDFLMFLLSKEEDTSLVAFHDLVDNKRNPKNSKFDVIRQFEVVGLIHFASAMRERINRN